MNISNEKKLELLKLLRSMTNASIKECQEALKASNFNLDLSLNYLNSKSNSSFDNKEGRATKSGTFGYYSHRDGQCLGVVELLCETDFVSKNADFKGLAKDLAVQVLYSPESIYLSEDEAIKDKDSINLDPNLVVFLNQPFFKDESITIKKLLDQFSFIFGEKLQIKKFYRFAI